MDQALSPAEMTPAERRAEVAEILARAVLRALGAAPEKAPPPPEKALELPPESSADGDQRAESS